MRQISKTMLCFSVIIFIIPVWADLPEYRSEYEEYNKPEQPDSFHPSKPTYKEQWVYPPHSKILSSTIKSSKPPPSKEVPTFYHKDRISENYSPTATIYIRPVEDTRYNYGEEKLSNPQFLQSPHPRPFYGTKKYPYYPSYPQGGNLNPSDINYYPSDYGDTKLYGSMKNGFGFGKESSLALLLGLLPAAILLASLIPNFVMVPVQSVGATAGVGNTVSGLGGRKRRSENGVGNPVLDLVRKYEVTSLDDPECLQRIICQITRQGRTEEGNLVQKLFYQFATNISDKNASRFGLKYLIRAIKRNKCSAFPCSAHKS